MERANQVQIDRLQKKLNEDGVAPHGAYRRESPYYNLLCFVNTIICLNISRNYSPIPVFMKRADKEIEQLLNSGLPYENYFDLLSEYFSAVADSLLIIRNNPVRHLHMIPVGYGNSSGAGLPENEGRKR